MRRRSEDDRGARGRPLSSAPPLNDWHKRAPLATHTNSGPDSMLLWSGLLWSELLCWLWSGLVVASAAEGEDGMLRWDGGTCDGSLVMRGEFPRGAFTVSVWVWSEGGQEDGATVVSVWDGCEEGEVPPTLELGIGSAEQALRGVAVDRGSRYFAKLQTEMGARPTFVWSPLDGGYLPGKWARLTASFDGAAFRLYLNGARVAVSTAQASVIVAFLAFLQ